VDLHAILFLSPSLLNSLQYKCYEHILFFIFRNLSFDTTEDGLVEHFEKYGTLKYAKVVINPNTEHSKGEVCLFKGHMSIWGVS